MRSRSLRGRWTLGLPAVMSLQIYLGSLTLAESLGRKPARPLVPWGLVVQPQAPQIHIEMLRCRLAVGGALDGRRPPQLDGVVHYLPTALLVVIQLMI